MTDVAKNIYSIQPAEDLLQPHAKSIARLRDYVGSGDDFWIQYYAPIFRNLADMVQELPASEAHHHDTAGGMLTHTIEVTLNALELSEHHLCVEQTQHRQVCYILVSLAVLHDLAKVLTDQIINLYDTNRHPLGRWCPTLGPMRAVAGAVGYTMRYRTDRQYRLHTFSGGVLVHLILPPAGHALLFRDAGQYAIFLALLSGYNSYASDISDLLTKADGASVASFKPGSDSKRMVATKRLSDHCLEALKRLVIDGGVRINAPGAMAFVTPQVVWFVSNAVLNRLRGELSKEGVSMPPNNIQVMDDLQHDGLLLVTNDKKNDKKAVHRCCITVDTWSKTLTMLGVDYKKLFGSEQKPLFAGSVKILGAEKEQQQAPEQSEPQAEEDGAEEKSEVEFWPWVIDSLNSGALKLNIAGAKFHFVAVEDQAILFMVSPNIFKVFAAGSLGDESRWKEVQRAFIGLKIARASSAGNLYVCQIAGTGTRLTGYLIDQFSKIEPKMVKINNQLTFKGLKGESKGEEGNGRG